MTHRKNKRDHVHERKESSDIIEIIYDNNGHILCKTFTIENINIMHELLKTLVGGLDKLICLDFHGVADLYENDDVITNFASCIISYVGATGKLRAPTRDTITARILNNQIIFGVMVFTKNPDINFTNSIDNDNCNKARVFYEMTKINKNLRVYFIDDGNKNIAPINAAKDMKYLHNVNTFLVNKLWLPRMKKSHELYESYKSHKSHKLHKSKHQKTQNESAESRKNPNGSLDDQKRLFTSAAMKIQVDGFLNIITNIEQKYNFLDQSGGNNNISHYGKYVLNKNNYRMLI